MIILALESSAKIASIAVWRENAVIYEMTLGDRLTHSQTLMPMVEQALKHTEITMSDIDLFAIDVGPGSFTGLRIGICSINAMAFSWNKPIIAISSLTTLAMNVPYFSGVICPLIDARNNQVYACTYQWKEQKLKRTSDYFAGHVDEWIENMPYENILFLGDGATVQRETILAKMPNAQIAMPHVSDYRAGSIASYAYQADKAEWCAEVNPLYLRESQAERMRKQNG